MKKLLLLLALVPSFTLAQTPEYKLAIKDHRFTPAELRIPANKKVKLVVANEDPTPEEFESHALNREKVIPGRSSATIFIGPLRPGRYPFEGKFNSASAKGVVIAQ